MFRILSVADYVDVWPTMLMIQRIASHETRIYESNIGIYRFLFRKKSYETL